MGTFVAWVCLRKKGKERARGAAEATQVIAVLGESRDGMKNSGRMTLNIYN
jgi:hypothetical protein